MWEILFGGILVDSGVNVTLEKDSNQGIDLSANIWGTDFHFSLKRYESSTHYNNLELFFEKLKPIIEQFREEITSTFIYFQTYPDSTILSNVEKKIKKELQTSNKTNTITNHINEPGQYLIIINHNKKQYKKIRLCPEIKWLCLSINQLCMNNLEKFFEEVYKESHFKEISSAQFADILRKYVFNRMPVDNENAGLGAMDKMVTQIHNKHSLIQN